MIFVYHYSEECCCSVAESCPILFDPTDCSTTDSSALHCLSEFAQTHVHWVSDAIQPSHPLMPSSPPAFNVSNIRDFSNELAVCLRWPASASVSVLPMSIHGWVPLRLTGLISLLSKRLSGVFSSTTVWRHQFFGILPSLGSSSHNHMWPLGRLWPWLHGPSWAE